MGLKTVLARLQDAETVTPATPAQTMGFQPKASTHAGCTPVTCVTPHPDVSEAANDTEVAMARRRCAGCCHRLPSGTCGEPVAAGLAPTFTIVWAYHNHAEDCPAFAAAPRPAADRRYRLTADEADRCHTGGWDDTEIATFVARHARLLRLGFTDGDADDLAERLTLRDRDGDDRVSCTECQHGRASRCPDGAPLPDVLHRCAGFRGASANAAQDAPETASGGGSLDAGL